MVHEKVILWIFIMVKLIASVESSIKAGNWYAALMVSLTLPDIAGKIEFGIPSTAKRYAQWFDKYIGPTYSDFLSGDDCYALRCSLLHEGISNISHQQAQEALNDFAFISPIPGRTYHCNLFARLANGKPTHPVLHLQVDLFCQDILEGVRQWLDDISCDRKKQSELQRFLEIGPFAKIVS